MQGLTQTYSELPGSRDLGDLCTHLAEFGGEVGRQAAELRDVRADAVLVFN